ncbi:MAG: alpha-L-arabinofuranosidase, partial [Prevotella sp.]|nr:alpha-L-arabinofuranosidase [Prevotella sp.]
GLFASSVWDAATGEVVVKVVNTSKQPQTVQLNLLGMKNAGEVKTLTLATNGSLDDENTLDQPEKIIPRPGKAQTVADKKAVVLTDELPAMAFRLYRIKK